MRTKIAIILLTWIALACGNGAEDDPVSPWRGGGSPGRGGGDRGQAAVADESVSVKAFQAVRRPISSFILSNTSLEAIRRVTIPARVNALVEEIAVEEGDQVRQGQTVAKLDQREIRNDFNQATIAVDQAEFALQQAEVRSQLSKSNFERSASLFEQKLISQQEFDQAALNNRTDELALDVAKQQLDAAKARLEATQIQLDYTEIVSPIDGVITERLIEVGQRVSPNEAAFTVQEFNPLWARIFIPERELTKVSLGQEARLKLQALPEEDFAARVHMISPTVDAESGTVKVTLQVRQQGSLRPGMFGTAYLATETHDNAVVIPKRAVVRERDDNRVFVVQADNTVVKKEVTLGFTEEQMVEVTSGLEAGEIVVTVGLEGLNEGYPVNVMELEKPGEDGDSLITAPPPQVSNPTESTETATQRAEDRSPGNGPAGSRGGRGGGRGFDPERVKQFLPRLLQNPEIKKIYDAKLAEDPNFIDDTAKFQAFFSEIRPLMGGGRGGRGRQP